MRFHDRKREEQKQGVENQLVKCHKSESLTRGDRHHVGEINSDLFAGYRRPARTVDRSRCGQMRQRRDLQVRQLRRHEALRVLEDRKRDLRRRFLDDKRRRQLHPGSELPGAYLFCLRHYRHGRQSLRSHDIGPRLRDRRPGFYHGPDDEFIRHHREPSEGRFESGNPGFFAGN